MTNCIISTPERLIEALNAHKFSKPIKVSQMYSYRSLMNGRQVLARSFILGPPDRIAFLDEIMQVYVERIENMLAKDACKNLLIAPYMIYDYLYDDGTCATMVRAGTIYNLHDK